MRPSQDTKLKNTLLIATTLIAFVSMILNVLQYQVSRKGQQFEQASSFPAVDVYRLKLSVDDIKTVRLLAQQEGISFSHMPNPAFLQDEVIQGITDEEAVVEYLIVANDNDVPLSNLRFSPADSSLDDVEVSYLAERSSLLIPEKIHHQSAQDMETLQELSHLRYDFSIGGNALNDIVLIPSPRAETIVFEAGLGPVTLSTFSFEEE